MFGVASLGECIIITKSLLENYMSRCDEIWEFCSDLSLLSPVPVTSVPVYIQLIAFLLEHVQSGCVGYSTFVNNMQGMGARIFN